MMKGIICLLIVGFGFTASLQAQDTTQKKSIIITSTFKPSLKNTAKLNFNADAPLIDTTRPVLQYNLPVQFLSLTYQPAGLNPVAISGRSSQNLEQRQLYQSGCGKCGSCPMCRQD